jgi:hypothetical protein
VGGWGGGGRSGGGGRHVPTARWCGGGGAAVRRRRRSTAAAAAHLGVVLERGERERALHLVLLLELLGHLERLLLHGAALEDGHVAQGLAVHLGLAPEELVRTEALLGLLAVDHRVGEAGDVPRGFPHLGRRDDRAVEADDVVAPMDHVLPPGFLDVLAQLDAQRPVVEEAGEAAIHVGALKDEAAPLAHVDHVVHVRHTVRPQGQVPRRPGRTPALAALATLALLLGRRVGLGQERLEPQQLGHCRLHRRVLVAEPLLILEPPHLLGLRGHRGHHLLRRQLPLSGPHGHAAPDEPREEHRSG